MNNFVAIGLGIAAAVLALAIVGQFIGPKSRGPAGHNSVAHCPAHAAAARIQLEAGTYQTTPFAGADAFGVCEGQPGCTESPADDSIAFTVTVPPGWSVSGWAASGSDSNAPPDGAMLIFWRGGWLYEDPCNASGSPSVEVGPTAEHFAAAIADHPLFDATEPVDVTLGGYAGKYVEVTAPSDIDQCVGEYRLWDPGIYAQGPEHAMAPLDPRCRGHPRRCPDHGLPGTPRRPEAELQAMVDSIEITP